MALQKEMSKIKDQEARARAELVSIDERQVKKLCRYIIQYNSK